VQCANRACRTSKGRNWFYVPARDLPPSIKCPLCGGVMDTGELLGAGREFERRVKGHVDGLE